MAVGEGLVKAGAGHWFQAWFAAVFLRRMLYEGGGSQAGLMVPAPGDPWSNEGNHRGDDEAARDSSEGYNEITLADIVRTLQRRKVVLIAVFILVVLGGVAVTAATTPQYESSASIIPLEHRDIITNWLGSRQAAQAVVESRGQPLLEALFPDRWDAANDRWEPSEPSVEAAGKRLIESVTISSQREANERYLEVTVRLASPSMARDVAQGYVDSLSLLRPDLENITRQEVFPDYYDGTNEQEARRLAEVEARQKDYWIVLDSADLPASAVVPNTTLNMALAVVLGVMLGVFSVFIAEWVSSYRAQSRKVDVPAPPRAQDEPRATHRKSAEAEGPRERVSVKAPTRRYR